MGTASEPMPRNRLGATGDGCGCCCWREHRSSSMPRPARPPRTWMPRCEPRLETVAKRYFEMSARGDTAALKQNSIAAVVASFAGIEAAVKENQAAFTGAKATVRPPFLLTADGPEPLARAEFLCGVFGKSGQTKDSAVFVLNNLPPGKYGVTIVDVNGGSGFSDADLRPATNRWGLETGGLLRQNPRRRRDTMPHGSRSTPAISKLNHRITMPGCITARRSPCPHRWTL